MHVHEPMQPRSRESQQRLMDAAARLLDQRSWGSMSIADIAREAGMSVGGFYARFRSKDALLQVLHERYETRRTEYFESFFADQPADLPLRERVRRLVEAVADWMHANRGVLRTFLVRFWTTPEELDSEFGAQLESLYAGAERFLIGDRDEIRRPHADKAARIALNVLTASCRDALVLKPPPRPTSLGRSRSDFTQEVTEILLCYLCSATTPRSR